MALRRIKIRGRESLSRLPMRGPPPPDELRTIFCAADLRAKTASAIIAFAGTRLEVLENYLGTDGLRLSDIPEMRIKGKEVEFESIPR